MMDPIAKFSEWMELAKNTSAITEPTAMTLATATPDGMPSARIVLLKEHDDRGFVFYTNFDSRKSGEIKRNPNVALCFWWMALERQVRIEGGVEQVSAVEADEYFASRVRESQIGAWASKQSGELASREELMGAVADATQRFEGKTVPRPPHWSGWRVEPDVIEFWEQSDFRLHDRNVYTYVDGGWNVHKLYP